MSDFYTIRLLVRSSACVALLIAAACVTSPVPGAPNSIRGQSDSELGYISLSDMIAGIKCEADTAMRVIQKDTRSKRRLIWVEEDDKEIAYENPNFDPSYRSFILYPGTVTLTANIKIIDVAGAKLAAVVPFGAVNTTSPAGNISRGATATKKVELTFRIDSYSNPELKSICGVVKANGIHTGGFISSAIIAVYNGIIDIPKRDGRSEIRDEEGRLLDIVSNTYHPDLRSDSLKLTSSFGVVWDGGIGSNARFGFSDIVSGINLGKQRTDTHTVAFNFPLRPSAPPTETRRVIDCDVKLPEERTTCLDRPFNSQKDKSLLSDRVFGENEPSAY